MAMMGVAALVLLFLFIRRVWFLVSVTQSSLVLISAITGLMGFQSVMMGLIAELLTRTYHESQGKSIYNVRKVISDQPIPEPKHRS